MSDSPFSIELPFPLSTVSRLGDRWRGSLVPVDLERMMRTAKRVTGLSDFGMEDGFDRRLLATLDSTRRIDWNLVGRVALRHGFHWNLINRLNVIDVARRRPELERIEIDRPIIILGLFRTGTTFLHNVMAADPRSRAASTWELTYPVGRRRDPLGDERWRRARSAIALRLNHAIVPDQDVVHLVTINAFEEDFFLLENDMAMMKFVVGFGDWNYAWDMMSWDMEGPYQWHRRQLQYLSAQRSADRWLLKCPWHLWNLDALLKVYPDARIVHIHRDVDKAIGSQCSLSARISGRMQRNLNLDELGQFWLDYSVAGMERGLEARERLPASQVFDVHLDEMRSAPGTTLERLYSHFDLPFDAALRTRFEEVAASEPTFQHGTHDYRLEDFGLNVDVVRTAFSDYRMRFGFESNSPSG